jgi:arginine decarboxylase
MRSQADALGGVPRRNPSGAPRSPTSASADAALESKAMSGDGLQSLAGTGRGAAERAEQDQTPYLDAIVEYAERRPGRFHVPGHKGGYGADPAAIDALGRAAFDRDVPAGIEGIDIGPDSPFQQAQRLAAKAWGARRSWFLINGASQGNHATCLALRHAGRSVVVQRNVHSSTIDGIILAGLEPSFVAPELDADLGVAHCLTPESLAEALDRSPDAVAALTVSPTYFGAVADVSGLAEVCHDRNLPLVVDEAWGSHLRFSPLLPASALECDADLVLSSIHKLLGSLTQSAILHLGQGGLIDEDVVDRCVTLTESTSPSALLTASLDAARRYAAVHGAKLLAETVASIERARADVQRIGGLDVLDERLVGRPGVHGWDPLRLAVDVRATGSTGTRLASLMRELDDINLELVSENVIVAAFGLGEDAEASAARFVAAPRRAVETLGADEQVPKRPFTPPPPWGSLEVSPREAFFGPQEVVPFDEAVGRVAAESLAAYPPGIPNVLPGERLTQETVDYIREVVEHGGWVRGAVDRSLRTIRVVSE